MKERIAALKNLPPGQESEDEPKAGDLLQDQNDLESELMKGLIRSEVYAELKPTPWNDLGECLVLPNLENLVKEFGSGLKGVTPEVLPAIATQPDAAAKRFKNSLEQELPDEELQGLFGATVGAALALALVKKGWKLESHPGFPVVIRQGSHSLEPLGIMHNLRQGIPSPEEWDRRCTDFAITGIDLSQDSPHPRPASTTS